MANNRDISPKLEVKKLGMIKNRVVDTCEKANLKEHLRLYRNDGLVVHEQDLLFWSH
jgi:hypothetical protein